MLKRVWILIIMALIILCLTACKSPAEKRLEEAQEAARRAEEAAGNGPNTNQTQVGVQTYGCRQWESLLGFEDGSGMILSMF